ALDVGNGLVAFQTGLGFGRGGGQVLLLGRQLLVGVLHGRVAARVDGLLASAQIGRRGANGVERVALTLVHLAGLVLGALRVGRSTGLVGHALVLGDPRVALEILGALVGLGLGP